MNTHYAVGTATSGLDLKHAPWLQVFSTCPSSSTAPDRYAERVAEVARWSERAGCTGILVYTDNSIVDPWMVSQIILQNTRLVESPRRGSAGLHAPVFGREDGFDRRLLVRPPDVPEHGGGRIQERPDGLGDATPHDSRYQRLVEYTTIIQQLLEATTVRSRSTASFTRSTD